jgi:hypothetical protein
MRLLIVEALVKAHDGCFECGRTWDDIRRQPPVTYAFFVCVRFATVEKGDAAAKMKVFSSAFHLRFMHREAVSLRDENKPSPCWAATSVRSAFFDTPPHSRG